MKKLYEGLSEKGANVHIHGHDRNVSINNYLKTQYPEMTNANDTWQATKNVAKCVQVRSISMERHDMVN